MSGKKIKYQSGEFIGQLEYVEDCGLRNGRRMANFKCRCGKIFVCSIANAKSENTVSCKCHRLSVHTKHGYSKRGRIHLLAKLRASVIDRCYNPNATIYKHYGGRGVTVCEEWLNNSKSFIDWCLENGWEKGSQLDKDIKKPGNLVYCPEACTFVSQSKNKKYKRNSRYVLLDDVKMNDKTASLALGRSSTYITQIRKGTCKNRYADRLILLN